MTTCLDSWAVLAWLDGEEPARTRVDDLLRAGARPVMSWINVAEVSYRVERDHGAMAADEVIAGLRRTLALDLPTTGRVLQAARLKARVPIALADCFAAATAAGHSATLLTGDPELIDASDLPCFVEDLRG